MKSKERVNRRKVKLFFASDSNNVYGLIRKSYGPVLF